MEPEGFGHHGASGSVQSLNASLSPFQRPLIQHQASFSSSVLNSIIINGGPVHGRASIPAQSAISEHPPPLLSRPAECLLSLCLPYDDLSHLVRSSRKSCATAAMCVCARACACACTTCLHLLATSGVKGYHAVSPRIIRQKVILQP
eukprot:1136811-Pelagomonas_calceolata.AAC.7